MAIFFRSCSFAAQRLISGLILAIYAALRAVPNTGDYLCHRTLVPEQLHARQAIFPIAGADVY